MSDIYLLISSIYLILQFSHLLFELFLCFFVVLFLFFNVRLKAFHFLQTCAVNQLVVLVLLLKTVQLLSLFCCDRVNLSFLLHEIMLWATWRCSLGIFWCLSDLFKQLRIFLLSSGLLFLQLFRPSCKSFDILTYAILHFIVFP